MCIRDRYITDPTATLSTLAANGLPCIVTESLVELSEKIGLNIKKLKEGFKQIYGDTVYGYLLDYKMNEARRMLSSRNFNVNEVGLKIGYSTSSHFISAFKKKFGTTPKKYLMSVSS